MDEIKITEPISTEPTKNNRKWWILGLALLLVVVGLVGFYVVNNFNKNNFSEEAVKEKTAIYSRSQVNIPEINTKKSILPTELPKDIAKFLPNGAKNIKAYSIKFKNNSTGIIFSYDVENVSLMDIYDSQQMIIGYNNWTTLGGSRSDEYGFLDFKNDAFEFDIQFTSRKSSTIYVEVTAIEAAK